MLCLPKKGQLVRVIHNADGFTWKDRNKNTGVIHFLKTVTIPPNEYFEFTAWFHDKTLYVIDVKRSLSCYIYHDWTDRIKSFKNEWMSNYAPAPTDPCRVVVYTKLEEKKPQRQCFVVYQHSPFPSVKKSL